VKVKERIKEFIVPSPLTGEGEDEGESLDSTCHGMSTKIGFSGKITEDLYFSWQRN